MSRHALVIHMFPILLHLGPVTIYSYGVLVAVGLAVGWAYASLHAPRAGLNAQKIWAMGLYASLAGLITARLWVVLRSPGYFSSHPYQILSLHTLQEGGAYFGGLFGALGMIALYSRHHRMPTLLVMDTCAPGLALGHAIGRIGCFAVGCCYGKASALPWAVTFSSTLAARLSGVPLHVPLHPTQLYEAGAELLNFRLLAALVKIQRSYGQTTGAYFVLYGLERFVNEFFRGDPGRTLVFQGRISLMQLISIGLVGLGLGLLLRRPGSHRDPLKAHLA